MEEFGDKESIEPREKVLSGTCLEHKSEKSLKKEVFSEAEWAEKDFNG